MTSCAPCARAFDSPSALRQHLRSSAAHPFCAACDAGFMTEAGYLSHCRSKHSPECGACREPFGSWDDVEEHWRISEAHPRCERCSLGFEEYRFYVKHMNGQHAAVPCPSCNGLLIAKEDLDKHYVESPRHPTCQVCHVGFANDPAFVDHSRTTHAGSFCSTCGRHFDSVVLLQEHFTRSVRHPTCPHCGIGFLDDETANEHASACPETAKPPSEKDSTEATPTKATPLLRAIRMRGHHSTPSEADLTDMAQSFLTPSPSPARPRPESGFPCGPRSPPMLGRSASEMSELDLAAASVLGASPLVHHVTAIPEIAVQDACASSTDPNDEYMLGREAPPPDDADDGDITAPSRHAPRLLMPQALRLRIASSGTGAPEFAAARSLQALPSVAARESRLLDEQDPTDAGAGADASGTSTPSATAYDLTPRSPYPPAPAGTPFAPPLVNGSSAAAPRGPSLVYCRICGQDPCSRPTATMCGHVFCKECIEEVVMRTSRCPVCSQAVLLYCLFRLYLD